QAVDLSFNPAHAFEKKLTAFVNTGGSAAQYLHVDEVFHMDVPIILIAWCKMENRDSTFYGQESGGYVRRDIAASILYNGDPAVVDGVGVIAATKATGATVAAPQPPQTNERPIRATQDPQPPARRAGD